MKKKGFTLIELIAVMAIMMVLLTAVLGIYVNGIKRSNITKDRTDMQNEFSNAKAKISKEIGSDDVTTIINKKIEIKALTDLNQLTPEKAYLSIKNTKDDSITFLVSLINKNRNRDLYLIRTTGKDIDNGESITINKIESCIEVSNNVSNLSIKEFNNGLIFNIGFSIHKSSRNYEFLLSKKTDEIVISDESGNGDSEDGNINLDDFFKNISGITILNDAKIEVDGSLSLVNTSYFINGLVKDSSIADEQLKEAITTVNGSPVFTSGLENNNDGKNVQQGLPLAFTSGNFISGNNNYGSSISNEINNLSNKSEGATALLNSNDRFTIYNNYEDLKNSDIKNSIGSIIKIANRKYVVLINGDLNIEDILRNGNSMLIYSTGNMKITKSANSLISTSIICGGTFIIDSPSVYMYKEYEVDDDTKACISKFLMK
ncbi:MAG: type II secretion system protein [Clostridium sp.]|uniref:type II secretion system protein n=1 Tax=Clostridium sp. TaxID=1506 RepID=UPI003F30B93F